MGSPSPTGSLAFLHGAGGGGWEWAIWQRHLKDSGLLLSAPDLKPAERGLAATHLDDYRRQAKSLLRALPQPLVMVGASMGGWLALALAETVAARALVLVNPVAPAPIRCREPRGGPELERWSSSSLLSTLRALPDGDFAAACLARARWRDESGAVLRELEAGAPLECWPELPVLILAGERDRDCPSGESRRLAERLEADFVMLPGASHLGPLLGRPASSAAALAQAWLSRQGF